MGTRTAEVGRLIELAADAIKSTRENKRSSEQVAALLDFLQEYKENKKEKLPKEEKKEEKKEIKMLYTAWEHDLTNDRRQLETMLKDKALTKAVEFHCQFSKKLKKIIERGIKYGFNLHFLPRIKPDKNIEWITEPNFDQFNSYTSRGLIEKNADWLRGELVLVDTRAKPPVKSEGYYKDFLLGSRFGKRLHEIRTIMFSETCRIFGVENHQIRFPRFIEFCYLANLFYPYWLTGNTQEWFGDVCHEEYACGGGEVRDNRINFHCGTSDRDAMTAFRPLIILGFLTDEEYPFVEA